MTDPPVFCRYGIPVRNLFPPKRVLNHCVRELRRLAASISLEWREWTGSEADGRPWNPLSSHAAHRTRLRRLPGRSWEFPYIRSQWREWRVFQRFENRATCQLSVPAIAIDASSTNNTDRIFMLSSLPT